MAEARLHNKCYRAMKRSTAWGFQYLRFNFRGVGAKRGNARQRPREQDDVRAALDGLEYEFRRPFCLPVFVWGQRRHGAAARPLFPD